VNRPDRAHGIVPVDMTAAAPAAPVPTANPHFERIGGAAAIRMLCERFYRNMDELPQARTLRALHPPDLSGARETLYEYLVGWMGGPPLYAAKKGPPRLRHKHLPFAIGDAERDAWMQCMTLALQSAVADAALREELQGAFFKVATFLRNR